MQRLHLQVPVSWLVLAILAGMNLLGFGTTIMWLLFPQPSPENPYRWFQYAYDGSVEEFYTDGTGVAFSSKVIRPASAIGFLQVWWPAAAGVGFGLLTFAAARTHWGQRLAEKRLGLPQMTMLRGMVIIAAISVWLWLTRTEMHWLVCGSLVLLFLLFADIRRSALAKELKTNGPAATAWLRLGIAGYFIAVLLALSWVVSVFVWDLFRPGPGRY